MGEGVVIRQLLMGLMVIMALIIDHGNDSSYSLLNACTKKEIIQKLPHHKIMPLSNFYFPLDFSRNKREIHV